MNLSFDLISILVTLSAWIAIGIISFNLFKRQTTRPTLWKAVLVFFVGIFSFSIHLQMADPMIKIPVLPLGVWIVYFFFRGKEERWLVYRPYAWLGFFANFIFLAATLLSIPIHQVVYPPEEPATYLTNIDEATVIPIHPSAKDQSLNRENVESQIHKMTRENVHSDQWYEEAFLEGEPNRTRERFPYQLAGASPKWGSGIRAVIYIEDDGKGLLVTTPKQQHYFRTEVSLLKGAGSE